MYDNIMLVGVEEIAVYTDVYIYILRIGKHVWYVMHQVIFLVHTSEHNILLFSQSN